MMATPVSWHRIESLLHRVQKPGRYVGGEFNAVTGNWSQAEVHICLAFPDLYDLGMSNYALQILYAILNNRRGILAHRTYLPAPDMITLMRDARLPLYTMEDYHRVADYDILAISTAYEQLYTNILELLDLAGLPLRSVDRDMSYPLIIGGGHGTFNPEPVADFFDAFVIGEGEEVIVEICEAVQRSSGAPRLEQLQILQQIPGVYVPRLFDPDFQSPKTKKAGRAELPPIHKRVLSRLPDPPIAQIVPNIDTVHNRAVIEIQRGCTRGCRFCQAGTITRPIRERPVEEIVQAASAIIQNTGYEELALLSLSSADYTHIKKLLEKLLQEFEGKNVSIAVPSLRIESFSVDLADMLSHGRRSGFTFAPEAGSETMRYRINKNISDDELLAVAEEVFQRGWRTIKLYFMIGLPGETDTDVQAIIELAHQVRKLGLHIGGRKTEVHVSVSTFVPKPHTPFQWEPLADQEIIEHRQGLLQKGLRGRGLRLSWNPYPSTYLEALLARGDRSLSDLVESAWRQGARFDAWDEWCNMKAWEVAIRQFAEINYSTLDAMNKHYLYRNRTVDEALPWDHLLSGIDKRFLVNEYVNSQHLALRTDCREECHACGILRHYRDLQTETWGCPLVQ
ncbi:MAG: TIGR03960 family B12-binding radical SAM protein [Anaerolineae bacterium]|nr:TIGR03960 family B12-binding radical SAM protein [Anaerolineae bacterium]